MRRLVDHVICKLPFEASWYRQRGCNAIYVGHPYFDQMQRQQLDRHFLDRHGALPGRLVTILPGSRSQEVAANLPWFLQAADIIRRQAHDVRFAVAAFNEKQAAMARRQTHQSAAPVDVFVGKTPELIRLAHCCMACSGSVSLELLHHAKPTVILYWVNRAAYFVQGFFRKVKYITLVNLLAADDPFPQDVTPYDPNQPGAEKALFPEYLTCEDKSRQIAAHVIQWLNDAGEREASVARLLELRAKFGAGGASGRAAEYILQALAAAQNAPLHGRAA
jgi:lipid-A-disaccharide synthase